jgi:hypothetical protein
MRLILISFIVIFLSACDGGIKASDYIGGYVSTTKGCPSKGDLGMYFQKSQVDISFYCFLKECGNMKGKVSKEGFFHLDSHEGYFIKGKITPLEAEGSWFMNIRGKDCYGYWVGLKN